MPTPPASNSRIEQLILVVEHRRCERCNRVHRTPNPHIQVKIRDMRTRTRPSALVSLADIGTPPPNIPHRITEIHTTSEACHLCFKSYMPDQQLELWPRPEPEPAALRRFSPALLAARASKPDEEKVKPLDLSFF